MSDMSFPSLGGADEFGGLDHLVPPGQDPELIHRLHAAFTAELEPRNFIERMWVRDMTIQTAMLEYVRRANCAVHRLVQDEIATDSAGREPREEDAQPAEEGQSETAGLPKRSDETMAQAFAQHLTLIDQLLLIERGLIGSRDGLINAYDNRTGIVRAYEDALLQLEVMRVAALAGGPVGA